ncbi:MAG: hypothetical protein K0Q60_4570 [Microvirga sp.]|nr:hypothetical protein [Microvirga sp.]
MEHKPLVDLQTMAHLSPAEPHRPMTRVRRLERWIEALPRHPKRTLRPLREIEYQKPADQRSIRADDSAITVAYEDLALRAEGLAGDTLGDAMDFFELSEEEAHTALCSCYFGSAVEARVAASRVRAVLNPAHRTSVWSMFR